MDSENGGDSSVERQPLDVSIQQPIRVIEWFSGIGGWSFALRHVAETLEPTIRFEVIAAVDINTIANEVYSINLGLKPMAKSIESLSELFFKANPADLWVMSPPCQPFTRNHDISTTEDNRTHALEFFVDIINKWHTADGGVSSFNLPRMIALENVVGFETSQHCASLLSALTRAGYEYNQYILTPTQFQIPNERPRYFLIARRSAHAGVGASKSNNIHFNLNDEVQSSPIKPLKAYLLYGMGAEELEKLYLPESLLSKPASWCIDLVHEESTTSACFTKAYSRFLKGTGSVLIVARDDAVKIDSSIAVGISGCKRGIEESSDSTISMPILCDPSQRKFEADWKCRYPDCKFRYLAPRELLNLFGFPREFEFPVQLSNRKMYELIGNSINVHVAARVIQTLFSETW